MLLTGAGIATSERRHIAAIVLASFFLLANTLRQQSNATIQDDLAAQVRRRLPRSALGGDPRVTISPTTEPRINRIRPPAEQRLYSYLFGSPSFYLKHVRPVIDHATRIQVRLGVCIMTIDDIVEKDQTMLSTGCVKMKWLDEVLQWDPAQFDNLTWIVIPSSEIWIPDVALVNSPDPFEMTKKVANVELSFTGEIGYYPSGRFSTRCPVSLTYFPFDAQLCELQFESWAYPVHQLEIVEWPVEPVDMKSFVTNHQWRLDGVNVHTLQTFYDGYNFSTIRFHFFFHRRSLYYTVYAVYPCLLMAALQLFSHTLPVEHPGRMALLTSLFIGSSVVQSSITASMPKSSDGISVIQVYLMLYSASLLVSIIITSVNMHIFYRTPDDSSPGIVPLFCSFLLTFGIRPTQKQAEAEATKAASSNVKSEAMGRNSDASWRKRYSTTDSIRRRRSSSRHFLTLSSAPAAVRKSSTLESERLKDDSLSVNLKSSPKPSGDDDNVSLPDPTPPPPMVKSPTAPFMQGQVSTSTHPIAPTVRNSITALEPDAWLMGNERRWSIVPPPIILTGEQPEMSMGGPIREGSNSQLTKTGYFEMSELPLEVRKEQQPRPSLSGFPEVPLRESIRSSGGLPDERKLIAKVSTGRTDKAEQASRVRIRHAWLTYAAIIDKVFFYSMGIINFIAPIILFLVMPAIQQYPGGVSTENMIPSPDAR